MCVHNFFLFATLNSSSLARRCLSLYWLIFCNNTRITDCYITPDSHNRLCFVCIFVSLCLAKSFIHIEETCENEIQNSTKGFFMRPLKGKPHIAICVTMCIDHGENPRIPFLHLINSVLEPEYYADICRQPTIIY